MTAIAGPDRAGRSRSPAAIRGARVGRVPANKGKRYPPAPPPPGEILRAFESLGKETPQDLRLRALIALLWRGGLGITEALAVSPDDLDVEAGLVRVRRRGVLIDGWALERIGEWMEVRRDLPPGPLLCVVRGPTKGMNWNPSAARIELARLAESTGVGRLAPMQLRHAHVVELMGRGVPLRGVFDHLGQKGGTHSRIPAALLAVEGVEVEQALRPPAAEERRRKGTASGTAYSLVRRAAQATDGEREGALTPAARRAWSRALRSLYAAEEAVLEALAEDP